MKRLGGWEAGRLGGVALIAVIAGCSGAGDCGPSDLEVDVTNPAGCAFGPLASDNIALDVHLRDTDFTIADARFVSDDYTRFVFAIPSWANPNEVGYVYYQRSSGGSDYAYGAFAPVTIRARCSPTSQPPSLPASQPP